MYKLIIVEDELFVKIGLEHAVNWSAHCIEIAATASNGKEALELYHKIKPHIIITDIKMPIMDGLQLIGEIRKIDKSVKFIILTCLEDFHMAQQAVKYSVSNYFTKYDMDIGLLEQSIASICSEISQTHPLDVPALTTVQSESQILSEYIFNESHTQLPGCVDNLIVAQGVYLQSEILVQLPPAENSGLLVAAANVIKQLLKPKKHIHYVGEDNNRFVLLFAYSEQPDIKDVQTSIEHVIKMLMSYLNLTSTVIVGYPFTDITLLKSNYKLIEQNAYIRFYLPGQPIIWLRDHIKTTLDIMVKEQLTATNLLYKECFSSEYANEFCDFSAGINSVSLKQISAVKGFIFQWAQLFVTIMHLLNEKIDYLQLELSAEIEAAASFDDAIQILWNFMKETKENTEAAQKISYEIMMAIRYIQSHLDQNLSLPIVANHINFSAGYLSYMFKKELNMSFTDFILQMRIKQAKIMLAQTEDKFYIIAEKTGFHDPGYFNKVFKRIVGITPSKFRLSHRRVGEYENDT